MFLLIRKILKKSKTGKISGRILPVTEKPKVNLIKLNYYDESTPSSDVSMKEIKPLQGLKRQCTIQELDKSLAKLRKTLSTTTERVPRHFRHTYNATPPQLFLHDQNSGEHEYFGNASSTVSEEDDECDITVVKPRKSNMIRRISTSKQRFSSPPLKSSEASIERCYSQNSERFQFRLSQTLLPSFPIEEDDLSAMESSTPLPVPMQPIVNVFH
uniref:Uncharacterized protein n=1 Tax=Panagrolaimus sp. ES5 TaxID=591445 RepID=A0AC34GAP2_9BILA